MGIMGSPAACSLTHSAIFGRCLFFLRTKSFSDRLTR